MGTTVLAGFDTAAISDALDLLDLPGALLGPRRLSGTGPVTGPAFTVRFDPVAEGQPGPAADYIEDVPAGSVIVIANGNRACTVWGDILTQVAVDQRIAGTVIDGYCRDIDRIRDLDYSMWASDAFMRSGKNRVRLTATGVPIQMGPERVTVRPGDLVCADGSGVLVVPADAVADVAERAAQVEAMEERVLRDIRAGVPLRRARATHGYHRYARRLNSPTAQ